MASQILWLSLTLVCVSLGGGVSGCDTDTLSNITVCMATTVPRSQDVIGLNFDLAKFFEQLCRDDVLSKTIACVKPFIDSCKDSEIHEYLTQMYDLNRMTKGWTYICDNLDGLKEQSECISSQSKAISGCIEAKIQQFSAETKDQPIGEVKPESSCKYQVGIYECMLKFTNHCGDFDKILDNFFRTTTPPVCDKYKSSSSQLICTPLMLAIGAVVSVSSLNYF